MNDFVIIPDSSCDMDASLRARFGVADYLPGEVLYPDGHTEKADLDWTTRTPAEYYGAMKEKNSLVKTAIPSLLDVIELYEKYLKQGKDVLALCLSTGLSGMYGLCVKAAEELKEKYPERKVRCFDTLRYSTAIALYALLADELRSKGEGIDEVVEHLESVKHTVHEIGSMDDLFFLCKTGRVSNANAFFGTLIGINPMADFNRQGLSEVIYKSKGKMSAFKAAVEYMRATGGDFTDKIVFISHSDREKYSVVFKEMIEQALSPKDVIITNVGVSCGASVGPGLVAAFYFGDEISEGLIKEKELMLKICEKGK